MTTTVAPPNKNNKTYWNYRWAGNEDCTTAALFWFLPKEVETRNILDVGCGGMLENSGGSILSRAARSYTGVDLSDVAVEKARVRVPNASFVVADATALPFEDRKFDMAISFSMLGLVGDDYYKVISEMVRVSSEGIAFNVPHEHAIRFGESPRDLRKVEHGTIFSREERGLDMLGLSERGVKDLLRELGLDRIKMTVWTQADTSRAEFGEFGPMLFRNPDIKASIFVKAFRE